MGAITWKSQNVADFDEERDSSTSEGKEREMKNLKGGIKKLKKVIEKGSSNGGSLIGRNFSRKLIRKSTN